MQIKPPEGSPEFFSPKVSESREEVIFYYKRSDNRKNVVSNGFDDIVSYTLIPEHGIDEKILEEAHCNEFRRWREVFSIIRILHVI